MIDLNRLEEYRENNRIEAKRALGGLPKSIWETYSAFANTLGGLILMGVEEYPDKSLHAVDLPYPEVLIEEFLAGLNDPRKVSANILSEDDITIETVDGKRIIVVRVPRAPKNLKPVYIDGNHIFGSYHRNGEGDYRCTAEELLAMYREAHSDPEAQADAGTVSEIRKSIIISYLTDHIEVKEQELEKLLGIGKIPVRTLMSELIADGIVTAKGGNRNRKYKLRS